MEEVTYTRGVFVTGCDDKGNEYFYLQILGGGWFDGYNECPITSRYIANYILPNIVKVRFGDLEVTKDEWCLSGCPFSLSNVEIEGWKTRRPNFVRDVVELEAERVKAERWAAEAVPVSVRAECQKMDNASLDFGGRAIISGGEPLELDAHLESSYDERFEEDMPF